MQWHLGNSSDYKRTPGGHFKVLDQMPRHPQTTSLECLHCPARRSPPYPPTSTPMRIKSLLQHHVFPYMLHVAGALAKLKSTVAELLKNKSAAPCSLRMSRRSRKKQQQQLFPTIQMHYSWSSTHVLPVPELPSPEGIDPAHLYYDSTWNSVINASEEGDYGAEPQLSGYLHWLEEKQPENSVVDQEDADEINRLAEKFIANCHEKFRLEKQESYRRYQEMLARSI